MGIVLMSSIIRKRFEEKKEEKKEDKRHVSFFSDVDEDFSLGTEDLKDEESDDEGVKVKGPLDGATLARENINGRYDLYITDISSIEMMKDWAYNRALDKVHVKSLCGIIVSQRKEHQKEHWDGRFVAVQGTCGKFVLVEGQHRRAAAIELRRTILTDLAMDVILLVYRIDTSIEEGNSKINEIFGACNNQKNCTVEDHPDVKIMKIVDEMKKIYKDSKNRSGIRSGKGTVQYPTVGEKELIQQLKMSREVVKLGDVPTIVAMIRNINNEWGLEFAKEERDKQAQKFYETAKDRGNFWISLVGYSNKLDYSTWIEQLEQKLVKKFGKL